MAIFHFFSFVWDFVLDFFYFFKSVSLFLVMDKKQKQKNI